MKNISSMVVLSHYIALSPAPWTTAALRLETLQGREVRLAWSADTRSHLTPSFSFSSSPTSSTTSSSSFFSFFSSYFGLLTKV